MKRSDPAIHYQYNLIEWLLWKLEKFRCVARRFDKFVRNFFLAVLLISTSLSLHPKIATAA